MYAMKSSYSTKTDRFAMRVEAERKRRWALAAERDGLSLSAWVGVVLDQAAAGRLVVERPHVGKADGSTP
jgi:predicted HicB family RNase H-like nuclease